MTVTQTSRCTIQYWEPRLQPIRYATDEEYAEHFRSLLEESVTCRMRASTPVGVLMSGGLDSTAVASLIARQIAPLQLTTISYVFDDLSECDERAYIQTVQEKWNTRSIYIPCDDAWPLKDWDHWVKNPNFPEGNPYRLLKERAYQRAHEEGLRVFFTGGFGDELYSGADGHILHLLFDGYFAEAARELGFHIRNKGMKKTLLKYLRHLKRYMTVRLPKSPRSKNRASAPAWLTPFATGFLANTKPGLDPRFEEYTYLFGMEAAQDCSMEIFNASRHSIELRHPFHDRRLIEFMINIPGYQAYRRGIYKHILRMAMKNILPEAVRACPIRISNFSPLYERGFEREQRLLQDVMQANGKRWSKFVSADWIKKNGVTPTDGGARDLVPWMCVSYERYRAYIN
jgi:asparagine synthase (glutamine-hydrolysing)